MNFCMIFAFTCSLITTFETQDYKLVMNINPPIFSKNDSVKFFRTLNKRVNDYFKENNIKKTGNWKLHLKAVIMFSLLLTPYFVILALDMPVWAQLLLICSYGYWYGRNRHECNARWQPRFLFRQIMA